MVPDFHGNCARAPDTADQLRYNFLCLRPALAVHANFGEKRELIGSPIDGEVPAVPITCFAHASDAALHTHTK